MNIAYLAVNTFPGTKAHKVYIMKSCEGLASVAKVSLFCTRKLESNLRIFKFYDIHKRFSIEELGVFGLEKMSFKSTFIIQNIIYAFKALLRLQKEQFDYIFTSEFYLFPFLAVFKKLGLTKPKIVFEIHNIQKNKILLTLERHALKQADSLIVITHQMKKYYSRIFPKERILVCRNGIDAKSFKVTETSESLRRKLGLPRKKIIGYMGSFTTVGMEKGIKQLIDAFHIVKRTNPNSALCFIGGTEIEIEAMKKYAQDKDIIFTGFVPHKQIPRYLKAIDIAMLPFPWTEHFAYYMSPMKLFEYMAAAKPIVASKLPAVEEIVKHGHSAFLVKPGDVHDLARGINIILRKPDLARQLAQNAFREVKKYTWNERGENIIRFLKEPTK